MRKIIFYVSLFTVIAFTYACLIPTISYAQPPGPGTGRTHYRFGPYDLKSVKTISGTAKGIITGLIGVGRYPGVIVIVETTQKEKYEVSLGPVWYFERKGFDIKEGDKVEVTGSDVTVPGRSQLLAAKVVKGDLVLELRDSNGIPYWASSRGCGSR